MKLLIGLGFKISFSPFFITSFHELVLGPRCPVAPFPVLITVAAKKKKLPEDNSLFHCFYVFTFEVKRFNMKIPFLLMNSCYLFPYH